MSISSSLQSIYDSKQAIKASLINKGQSPTDVLSTYSSLIDSIETDSKIKFTQGDFFYYFGVRATDSPFNDLDTSEMVSMNNMFNSFTGVSTIDISEWDMTKVTSMSYMFTGCNADYLVLGDLMPTALETNKSMFVNSTFKALDLHNLPMGNINTMKDLFKGCTMLESVNLTGWNTSNVTDMNSLFLNCNKLTSVDLSSFDTSNVTSMGSLFAGDTLLTSVTGFSIDCSNAKSLNASGAFNGCSSLTSLLFKSGGTMGGKSTNSSSFILDLSKCTALTEASVVAMINSCSANTSGYKRGFKLASSVYALLTNNDKALFTAKNYTVSA